MTFSTTPIADSKSLGRRSCQTAIERGKRILSALENRQSRSRDDKRYLAPVLTTTVALDQRDFFDQIPDGYRFRSGENPMPTFYEFFAGGGMARAGLGEGWHCVFANDFDEMKAATYRENWGADHLICGDVASLKTSDLPGIADLSWASFPCQDLSLAGDYRGLGRADSAVMTRSGTFWPFWKLMSGRDLGLGLMEIT
jgi:hypothetical protein